MNRTMPAPALAIALAVFLVDLLVKYFTTAYLNLDTLAATKEIVSFFRLVFVANCGISLGLLGQHADDLWVRVALVLVTGAIATGVLVWLWRERNAVDRAALGCVFGGAIGNIGDRVIPAGVLGKVTSGGVQYPGCVIDMLDLHFGDWRPFLVFNVADAAITIGVLILLVRAFLTREKTDPVENSHA